MSDHDRSYQPYEIEETLGSKLFRKSRESPFLVVGLTGMIVACGIGAYKFKHKGAMSTSVFLMQLRVAAQGTVIGCLTIGMAAELLNRYVFSKDHKPKTE